MTFHMLLYYCNMNKVSCKSQHNTESVSVVLIVSAISCQLSEIQKHQLFYVLLANRIAFGVHPKRPQTKTVTD